MALSGHQWQSVVISGTQWSSVAISGHQWQSVVIRGTQWHSVVLTSAPSESKWRNKVPLVSRACEGACLREASAACRHAYVRNGAVVSTCMRRRGCGPAGGERGLQACLCAEMAPW